MIVNKSGAVFLNKPSGITSFRALDSIKNKLSTGKIGHTGTLDKFASGVMIVLSGSMTKLAEYFSGLDKEYIGIFTFGRETDTLDPEGGIIAESDIPELSLIKEKLELFKGRISQIPPDYSAVHINGKRAYKLARKGDKPALKARDVTIYGFDILSWSPPELEVKIKCSKGTYIRSIARDLGRSCGSYAYVSSLKRTSVGGININMTIEPEKFNPGKDLVSGKELFMLIPDIQIIQINRDVIPLVLNGRKLKAEMLPGFNQSFSKFALFYEDTFAALVKTDKEQLKYAFVSGDLYGTYLG